jgi:hypothetical protein
MASMAINVNFRKGRRLRWQSMLISVKGGDIDGDQQHFPERKTLLMAIDAIFQTGK